MPEHHHGPEGPRISTPQERTLLEPFTNDLYRFVAAGLTGVSGPVVEVGAGDGVLAHRLCADGFDVVAIDANPETAAAATAQGRPVINADWLSWDGGVQAPFAAVVFTRSLHHIDPIDQAVEQILRLAPGGLLIGDEFGYERVDDAGAQLLADARALLAAAAMSNKEVVAVADPTQAWEHRMTVDHPITPSGDLLAAIAQIAEVEQHGYGRFFARFLAQGLDPSHPHAHAVRDVLIAIEDARISAGLLTPVGLRFVARIRA